MPTIVELIEAHRAAVVADEANFDDDGNCLNGDLAELTLGACNETLRALIEAPCRTPADVAAKIEYFATAKNRDFYDVMSEVIDMMFPEGGNIIDGARRLLKSLVIVAEAPAIRSVGSRGLLIENCQVRMPQFAKSLAAIRLNVPT